MGKVKELSLRRSQRVKIAFYKKESQKYYGWYSSADRLVLYFYSIGMKDSELVFCALKSVLKKTEEKEWCVRILNGFTDLNERNSILEYVLQRASEQKFDFCGMWDRQDQVSCPEYFAQQMGDVERVSLLIKYGFPPMVSYQKLHYEFFFERKLFHWNAIDLNKESAGLVMVLTYLAALLYSKQHGTEKEFQNIRECFILTCRSTKAIPCTPEELGRVIIALEPSGDLKKALCELYVREFPEIAAKSRNPHTLLHLSRCCVRKCLQNSWKLPNGLEKLEYPKTLRPYMDLAE